MTSRIFVRHQGCLAGKPEGCHRSLTTDKPQVGGCLQELMERQKGPRLVAPTDLLFLVGSNHCILFQSWES